MLIKCRYFLALGFLATQVAAFGADTPPKNDGPYQVLTASRLGGPGDDKVVAAGIQVDGTIVLAMNSTGYAPPVNPAIIKLDVVAPPPDTKKRTTDAPNAGMVGFICRLSGDGRKMISNAQLGTGGVSIIKMNVVADGRIFVLIRAGTARQIISLSPDASRMLSQITTPGASDFAVDTNGDFVVLARNTISRMSADGKILWTTPFKSFGDNRPGGMSLDPKTGITAVVGYGMTRTGHEPYKDPYGYGIDRNGAIVWTLWNPEPHREAGSQYGGNGLMADTTGIDVGADPTGNFLFLLRADGGNNVCTRDPHDVSKPLAPSVTDGVFQGGPGFGFKGASSTSVICRLDPTTGDITKATWMCAWINPARANSLRFVDATGDEQGREFVVGASASGCPTKLPWYIASEGGYKGGGFLAILDSDFKMLQCGYFPQSDMSCLAEHGGTMVIAGSEQRPKSDATTKPAEGARTFQAIQDTFGGGETDGYFVVLKRN